MILKASYWDSLANKEHQFSNTMDMAVWIQNYTNDTILFPIQDGSLIGLTEAIDKDNLWKPIEYWWFSWCGNSYYDLFLPPKSSIQIGINNLHGDLITKMRLKIHGYDTIYYSNEFIGTVSKTSFIPENIMELIMKMDKNRISFLDSIQFNLRSKSEIEYTEFEE